MTASSSSEGLTDWNLTIQMPFGNSLLLLLGLDSTRYCNAMSAARNSSRSVSVRKVNPVPNVSRSLQGLTFLLQHIKHLAILYALAVLFRGIQDFHVLRPTRIPFPAVVELIARNRLIVSSTAASNCSERGA